MYDNYTKQLKKTNNIEAEKDVLSALLNEHYSTSEILGLLKPEYFYDRRNGVIFSAVQRLHDLGEVIDIANIFEQEPDLSLEYAYELQREVKNPLAKAMIVHDKWTLRELIKTAQMVIDNANSSEMDVKDQTDLAIDNIKKITDINYLKKDSTLYGSLEEVFGNVKKRMEDKHDGLKSTYFPSLNRFTGGFRDGDYISLSGKDKAGKTSLAYSLALDYALNKHIPVGIFSLEMTKDTLACKAISLECNVEYLKLRNPNGEAKLSNEELTEIAIQANRTFARSKIYTCDDLMNERQIRGKIKLWQKEYGVRFVVIDYIGLIPTTGRFDNREREVAYLSRFFKLVSHELGTTILVLSQQNRQGEIAESKGLDRDSDFAFSIKKPLEEGINSIKVKKGGIERSFDMEENYFLVTLERSRHSAQGKQFIVSYFENTFRELDLER